MQRQVEAPLRRLDEPDHARDEPLERFVATDELRLRECILQIAHECVGIVAELDAADAFAGRRHQNRAERALADRKTNGRAGAALAEGARGHAEQVVCALVEAGVGVETGTVDRLGDGAGGLELVPDARTPVGIGISFRRHAGHGFEHAVEMEGAHARRLGEVTEARKLLGGLDQPAGLCHRRCVARGHARHRPFCGPLRLRLAALAGTEASALRRGGTRIEGDVVPARQARAAGRPAIDAGRAHRIVESAVGRAVAPAHCVPAGVIVA